MDKQTYTSSLHNASNSAKSWQKISYGLLASNALLVLCVLTLDKKEKTIIVPPGIALSAEENGGLWVNGEELSPAYLERLALNYLSLLLTYHRENVDYQYSKVATDMDPELLNEMRPILDTDIARVKDHAIASTFYPSRVSQLDKNSVIVSGLLRVMVGRELAPDSNRSYKVSIEYVAGRPMLTGYTEVKLGKDKSVTEIKPEPLNPQGLKDSMAAPEGGSDAE